jgi:drug/metabolite transporter (DMT)-like permease
VSPLIVALIALSACVHVGWNLLLKGAVSRDVSSWLAVGLSGVVTLPFVIAQTDARLWGIAALSALFQAGYYLLLAHGYAHYDLGVLYPIARGTAPLLSTLWSMLILGDAPNGYGIAAVCLITGGTIWIGLRGNPKGLRSVPWVPLVIALLISGYTIVDAYGTRASSPFAYYSVCMTCTGIAMLPVIWAKTPRLAHAVRRETPRAVLIGAGSFVSYYIVLSCYAVAPVSYVAAAREMSIIIAGVVGWLWLKESFGAPRLVGAVAVAGGVGLLVLLG